MLLSMDDITKTNLPDPSKGGTARARKLSPERRSEIARQAVSTRWAKKRQSDKATDAIVSDAKYKGFLNLVGVDIPCYVLNTGERVIGRTSATELLTGIKGGGDLEKY